MSKQRKHLDDRVIIYAIIWCLSYIGSLYVLKTLAIPKEAGIVLIVVTLLSFGLFIYKYYRSILLTDEVQIKIQMEAVTIAFSLSFLLLMTLGLVDLISALNKNDWSYRNLVPFFVLFYFIGLFISKRKYNFDNEKHH